MIAVSNASPVIFLSKLGALDLLAQCFNEVHIPVAVKAEIGDVVLPEFIQVTAISEFGQHYVSGAIGTKRSTVMTTFLSVSNFTTNIIN